MTTADMYHIEYTVLLTYARRIYTIVANYHISQTLVNFV